MPLYDSVKVFIDASELVEFNAKQMQKNGVAPFDIFDGLSGMNTSLRALCIRYPDDYVYDKKTFILRKVADPAAKLKRVLKHSIGSIDVLDLGVAFTDKKARVLTTLKELIDFIDGVEVSTEEPAVMVEAVPGGAATTATSAPAVRGGRRGGGRGTAPPPVVASPV